MAEDLKFPKFEDIPVSTKTFVVMMNVDIDIIKLYEQLPITEYTLIPKKRGRKPKEAVVNPNKDIESGSIISIEYIDNIRGTDLKKKKEKSTEKKKTHFRNSVTIVMIINQKMINFKISRNGKIQMTGCKTDEQAEQVLDYIWNYIKNTDIYTFKKKIDSEEVYNYFEAVFIPAMRNIDFSLGFHVNREELDTFINSDGKYFSLLETSFGYTGVNIKIPLDIDILTISIKRFILRDSDSDWEKDYVNYKYFLDMLSPREQKQKREKDRYNTFLVFHSGKTIMSGICAETQKNTYYTFIDMIKESYHIIQEKLDSEFSE